jgi:hypothetical protein
MEIIEKEDIPENRRTIKYKWIFKVKKDWWLVKIVKLLESTSMKALLR